MKNLLLSIFAFTFAIESSVASFSAPENVYVKAKLKSNPTGATVCVNTGVQCDASGTQTCIVIVPVSTGTSLAYTNGPVQPFRGTGCLTQLTSTECTPLTSTVNTIERLVIED